MPGVGRNPGVDRNPGVGRPPGSSTAFVNVPVSGSPVRSPSLGASPMSVRNSSGKGSPISVRASSGKGSPISVRGSSGKGSLQSWPSPPHLNRGRSSSRPGTRIETNEPEGLIRTRRTRSDKGVPRGPHKSIIN